MLVMKWWNHYGWRYSKSFEKNGNKIFDQTADNLMSKDPKWILSEL